MVAALASDYWLLATGLKRYRVALLLLVVAGMLYGVIYEGELMDAGKH